jgi:hypothetical protein
LGRGSELGGEKWRKSYQIAPEITLSEVKSGEMRLMGDFYSFFEGLFTKFWKEKFRFISILSLFIPIPSLLPTQ